MPTPPTRLASCLAHAGDEFTVATGSCVGHDSLFTHGAEGLATVVAAEDRVRDDELVDGIRRARATGALP